LKITWVKRGGLYTTPDPWENLPGMGLPNVTIKGCRCLDGKWRITSKQKSNSKLKIVEPEGTDWIEDI